MKKGNIFISIGLLLISTALFITIYNIIEDKKAENFSKEAMIQLEEQIADVKSESEYINIDTGIPLYKSNPDMEMPVVDINGVNYIGILSIPALSLELPVRGEWNYPALVKSPCRFDGSVYKDNMIIAGHNYSSHFGNLKHLMINDEVNFTDGDGNVFKYIVLDIEQIDGKDGLSMRAGEWDMTLFTCTPSGKKRVTIRLEKTEG